MQLDQENRHVLRDLAHQLRAPLSTSMARLNRLLRESILDDAVTRQLLAVRGLCRKAIRVANSANLYELLTSANPRVELEKQHVTEADVLKLLIEGAMDFQALAEPARGLQFRVDRGLDGSIPVFSADLQLLEQAVSSLLDNAAKYSFSDTVVRVSATLRRRSVRIRVSNRGIRVRSEDVPRCIERGWRGHEATLVTGEGSGIGLWVTNQIMEAHNGSLQIVPLNKSGETKVDLLFPIVEDDLQ